jgi:membrane protein
MPTPAPSASAAPGEQLSRLTRLIAFQVRLWRFCARRLYENNLAAMSAALSFRTIFALIPALVLALVAASALGFLDSSQRSLRAFLQASGFAQIVAVQEPAMSPGSLPAQPETGATAPVAAPKVINVADEMEQMVEQVRSQLTFQRIGPIGAALFIWTALSLLSTIESSLNRVFGAPRSRSVPRRVLLYWSTMTLGPVVLAIAVYLAGRAVDLCQHVPVLGRLVALLGSLGPVLVGVAVLAAVYIFVPNAAVRRRAAFGGALVAVLLWLAAKWAFALYVRRLVLNGNLYGILGAFPLFMMWLNLSWTIFLYGAELTHTAANLGRVYHPEPAQSTFVTPLHALTAMLAVARAYHDGRGPVQAEQVTAQLQLAPETARWLLDRLAASNLICAVQGNADERLVLTRPPTLVPVAEVLAVGQASPTAAAAPPETAAVVAQVKQHLLSSVADLTLADVLKRADAPFLVADPMRASDKAEKRTSHPPGSA